MTLDTIDWVVIAGYFLLLLGVAWWVIIRQKDTASDFFLAGRHLPWFLVGASIFASNIGSEHVVGLAGSGATDGVAMAHYELHAWCLLVLAWVFIPFYMRSMIYTMPEFLEKRFSPASRYILSIISLVMYIISKVAVGIFAGGVVFSVLLPKLGFYVGTYHVDSFWIGSVSVLILTGLYTMLGGMRAVVYTEALQTIVLVIGSVLITYFGMQKVGGWHELRNIVHDEGDPEGYVEKFNLWKPLLPAGVESTWRPVIEKDAAGNVVKQAWYFNLKGHYPWIGMLICAPVIGLWYWCTCQYIVQRALGAKDEQQARRGSIFAGFLKLLPVFVFIIPGVICFALAKSGKVPAFEGMIENGVAKEGAFQAAFPQMVIHVLPTGVRGIVVAGLLAALMSSLAGVFNASSTLFTMDLYQKYKPNASQHQLVWMGRMATLVCVLIGIAWIPVIKNSRGLYDYLQGVQGYLAPPIFVVFFLGVFWKRLNGPGCLAGLLSGFLLGLFRLALDTSQTFKWIEPFEAGSTLWIVSNIYFQYFSILITLVSIIAMVVVSYATAAPSESQIRGLTFATTTEEQKAESRASWSGLDVWASVALMAAIVAAYMYFRG